MDNWFPSCEAKVSFFRISKHRVDMCSDSYEEWAHWSLTSAKKFVWQSSRLAPFVWCDGCVMASPSYAVHSLATLLAAARLSQPRKSHGEAAIIREHLGGFSLLNGDRKMADDGKQQAQPPEAPPTAHSCSSLRRRGRRWRRSSGMVLIP